MGKNNKSTHPTLKAAKTFNRRTALKRGAAAAAFAGVAPMFVKNAFAASSGQVNVVMWGEYLPDSVVAMFKDDTGITFNKSIDWLRAYDPIKGKIEDIKTATLWKKQKSSFEPDFCAVKLKDNPWIVQPFEIYEEIRIEDIKKKHHK